VSRDSIVDGDWLPATDSLCRMIRHDSDTELRTSREIWAGVLPCTERIGRRKEFELILTIIMESRRGSKLVVNYRRSVIIAEL